MKKKYSQIFLADCPKCGALYKGDVYYFRFDIKETCFDGKTKLVNFRFAE